MLFYPEKNLNYLLKMLLITFLMFLIIFYLNCEYVLFVYILKQKQKKFADFMK